MKIKWFRLLFISFIVIGAILMTGCTGGSQKNSAFLSTPTPTASAPFPSMPANIDQYNEQQNELWFSVGQKITEISSIPGIDDPAILVNGLQITKEIVEGQKALQAVYTNNSFKDKIVLGVRNKVLNSEAIKQGIQPSQDNIDAYLKQVRDSFDDGTSDTDVMVSYMKGMGITIDEYMEQQKAVAYDQFQRDALRKSLPAGTDWNKYTDGLVEKADIQILDPEIQALFDGSQAMNSPP